MNAPVDTVDPPFPRTVPQLALYVERTPERIRHDLRRGRLVAMRPGQEWFFDPEQWEAAVKFYAEQSGESESYD